ncbi:MAG: hypothetical protein ABIQ54_04410 [Gammaproteobacteria bacterium]
MSFKARTQSVNIPYIMAFFAALVMGAAAATGKPIFSVLVAGTLGGIVLVSQPVALLWALLSMTLVVAGIVLYFIPTLANIWWITYGMGAMLFVPAIMSGLSNDRTHLHPGLSPTVIAALIFLVSGLFSTFINRSPPWEVVLALKGILLFGGVWAALALLPISKEVMKRWLIGFLIIGLIQWLPAIYQYLFVRADRLVKGLGTIEASDSVVGTFGGAMDAGGLSPVLAAYLIMLMTVLLALRRDGLLSTRKLLLALPFLFFPLLIMEVKVIVIYVPLCLFILYKDLIWRRPVAFFSGATAALMIMVGIIFAYQALHWSAAGSNIEKSLESMVSYSFVKRLDAENRAKGIMTRREVIDFWWEKHDLDEPVSMLLGHGLGASRTQGMGHGHIAAKYAPRVIDYTALALILWDTGLVGIVAVLALIISAFRMAKRLSLSTRLDPWQKSLARGLHALIPIFLVSILYQGDIFYAAPMTFMLMTVLGLLAWLRNQEYSATVNNELASGGPIRR